MANKKKSEEVQSQVQESQADTEATAEEAAPEMPSFDFGDCSLTDEEVEAKEKAEGGGAFFRPGRHDVVIQDVKFKGLAKDKNWGVFEVVWEGTGGKTIKDFPMIPFRTPVYKTPTDKGEKESMYPWKKFKGFCAGLGIMVQRSNLETVCKTHFAEPAKLKTHPAKIDVGFQGGHVAGAGDGSNFKIVLQDGNDLIDPKTKEPLLFADRAAAHNYAGERKLRVDKYVSVLGYVASEVKKEEAGGW